MSAAGYQHDGFDKGVEAFKAMPGCEEKRERSGRDAGGRAVLGKVASPAIFQARDRHLQMTDRVLPLRTVRR